MTGRQPLQESTATEAADYSVKVVQAASDDFAEHAVSGKL